MRVILTILLYSFLLGACNNTSKEKVKTAEKIDQSAETQTDELWKDVHAAIVQLESFDGDRILEKGMGFFVANDLVITRFSLVNQATRVNLMPLNDNNSYHTTEFVAVDRINDLILLKMKDLTRNPIKLYTANAPETAKSMYISPNSGKTIQLFTGKVLNLTHANGTRLYRISNRIRKANFGMPVFVSTQKAYGLAFSATVNYQMQSFATPSSFINDLLKKNKGQVSSLEELRSISSEKIAAANRKIKGLVLETDAGNITIRLYNKTPAYRDNFIKLAREEYFDSLLIHRVIADFGIQSGAADTRYAEKGDNVGWKGPGYTIPAHIVPGLFHRRGTIGSPRKPDTANQRRRSDGSQFYIVSGRRYTDNELDDLEKENNYTFSKTQRDVYKTIGGAPHLDGSYTVFGEVITGMDVVDRIEKVKTDPRWRPLEDIRINKVRILE